MPHDAFEVIVVDDGSQPPVADQVADLCTGPVSISVIRNDVPQQAGPARNRGAAQARFDVLLFLDAECYADVNLVSAHGSAQCERAAAYASYTAAREVTPEQWPLLVGEQWDMQDAAAVFAAIEQIPALDDPLASAQQRALAELLVFEAIRLRLLVAAWQSESFEQLGGEESDVDDIAWEEVEAILSDPAVLLPEVRPLQVMFASASISPRYCSKSMVERMATAATTTAMITAAIPVRIHFSFIDYSLP